MNHARSAFQLCCIGHVIISLQLHHHAGGTALHIPSVCLPLLHHACAEVAPSSFAEVLSSRSADQQ